MKNTKVIMSLLLVLLIALSISAVSADNSTNSSVNTGGNTYTVSPTGDSTQDIKVISDAIDKAEAGDTIDLGGNAYDVGDGQINITKNITLQGNENTTISGTGSGSGIIFISEGNGSSPNGAIIKGIIFNNTAANTTYTGSDTLKGWGICIKAASNVLIEDCSFINFNHGVRVQGGSSDNTIQNCYFTGAATSVTNDGKKESGTKGIGIMKSTGTKILDNTFYGQVLDGVSIASGSTGTIVENNMFINNCYAIYFGGASTQGSTIANNTFINCGYINASLNGSEVYFDDLPVISTQKACEDFSIVGNSFVAINNSVLIACEAANTAHGYPSAIGNFNITDNIVVTSDDYYVDPYTITFVHLLTNNGDLNPTGPINISNNTLPSGIKTLTYWSSTWGDEDGDVTIPEANATATAITVEEVSTGEGTATVSLKDINGAGVSGANVSYIITYEDNETNATEGSLETDEDGKAQLTNITGNAFINFAYAGSSSYAASTATLNYTSTAKAKKTTKLVFKDMNTTVQLNGARNGEWFNVTLTDEEGNILANKTLNIGFNGKVYNKTTDENGTARLQINIGYQSANTFSITFLGDDEYNGTVGVALIVANAVQPTLTASKTTYKSSAKTKTLKATLKYNNTGLSGKKITFTVNGNTYIGTTNKNGVASVTISLSTKKTYTYKASFAGDNQYKAVTKSAKLIIN